MKFFGGPIVVIRGAKLMICITFQLIHWVFCWSVSQSFDTKSSLVQGNQSLIPKVPITKRNRVKISQMKSTYIDCKKAHEQYLKSFRSYTISSSTASGSNEFNSLDNYIATHLEGIRQDKILRNFDVYFQRRKNTDQPSIRTTNQRCHILDTIPPTQELAVDPEKSGPLVTTTFHLYSKSLDSL